MRRLLKVLLGVALVAVVAEPAWAQADSWQRKWYWGAQGGVMLFKTSTATGTSSASALDIGGHWLITGKRSALYLGFDQLSFGNPTTTIINDNSAVGGQRTVTFSNGRRLQAGLYAIPSDKNLQIYLGGGFGINQITNAVASGTFATAAERQAAADVIDAQSTKAFAIISAGAQLRMKRLALFGTYQFMPSSKDFLITTEQHALTFGLRYALTSAHEDVTTSAER